MHKKIQENNFFTVLLYWCWHLKRAFDALDDGTEKVFTYLETLVLEDIGTKRKWTIMQISGF